VQKAAAESGAVAPGGQDPNADPYAGYGGYGGAYGGGS